MNRHRDFQLEEVFNPVVFLSGSGEKLSVVMRDSGFEVWYQKNDESHYENFEFKDGVVRKIEEAEPAEPASPSNPGEIGQKPDNSNG